MIFARWLRVIAPLFLSLLLLITACAKEPSRYADVQKETTRRGAPSAVVKTAEQGSSFNKFFPDPTGTYDVIPTQEKKGFAEYKLLKDNQPVAMLSISDTSGLPTAALKYKNTTESIAGYPAADQGLTTTGILVNDRYQVKVLSRDPAFTKDDRVAWLQKFDLRGLAKLEGIPAATAAKPAKPTETKATKAKEQAPNSPLLPPVLTPQPAT